MLKHLTRAAQLALSNGPFRSEGDESRRIQTLRGVACLLLVAFHAIGATATGGLHVRDDSAYRQFANIFVHIRMPLFTFISGFVYAYRPLRRLQAGMFALKKLRRLALPLLVAATWTYTLHVLLHDGRERPPLGDAWRIYVFPYEHFWFVQALLIVFAAIVVLESCEALRTLPRFFCMLALAVGLHLHPPFGEMSLLSMHEATYLLPYFLLGVGTNRFRLQLQSSAVVYVALGCFLVLQAWHTYAVMTTTPAPIDADLYRTRLGLAIGVSATLCALQLVPQMRWAAVIGKWSFPIYLYHPIFVAAFRVALGELGAAPTGALFVGCVIAGLTGPIALSLLADRVPGGTLLLEGKGGWRRSSIEAREFNPA